MKSAAKNPRIGWRVGLLPLACFWIGLSAGCEWMDQDDMKRYAIRRAPDDEDEEEEPSARKPKPTNERGQGQADSTEPVEAEADPTPVGEVGVGSTDKLADTLSPPEEPLTPAERAARSAENLERIAEALVAYKEDKGSFPPLAIRDGENNLLLSWRVELLPYLGYEQLYKKFDLDQPWYTPANKKLLKEIPAVYQSPERFDEKTCYRLPVGTATIFQRRTLLPQRIEDGLANTVFLLETDDAVAWTEPDEHEVDPKKPAEGLGRTRDGLIFLSWANGLVGAVPNDAPASSLKAMFTPDTGERFSMASVNRPIDPEVFSEPQTVVASTAPAQEPGANPSQRSQRIVAAVGSSAETIQLASTYDLAAAYSLAQNDHERAWRWRYGSIALGSVPVETFAWRPALRRPAAGVHFGIALIDPSGRTEARVVAPDTRLRQELASRTAPFGEAFLAAFERATAETDLAKQLDPLRPDATARSDDRREKPLSATCFTGENAKEVVRLAKTTGCDVLLMMSVDRSRRGRPTPVERVRVTTRVIDLVRDRDLIKTARMEATSNDRPDEWLRKDAYESAVWEWRDLLDEGLAAAEWPMRLTEAIAAKRLKQLGSSRDRFPLRAIAEMSYYQASGVVDPSQHLVALRQLVGEGPAMGLLLGDAKKKERALREWLPQQDAEAFVEEASRLATRLASANDDD